MNFNYLETFLSVIHTKTISGAAKELYLAQTTVSQRIKSLEKEIGIQLLERRKGVKEVILTPDGEEFHKLAEEWFRIKHQVDKLKNQGAQLSLTIGAVDSINTFIMPGLYRNLVEREKRMKLKIHTLHSTHLYSEVEKRRIDVAFSLRNRIHQNVNVEKCFESPLVVLRSSEAGPNTKQIHPEELDPNYELFIPWGQEYKAWHSYWWDPLKNSLADLDSTHLLLQLLQDPIHWAIMPRAIANKAIKLGNYQIYELTDTPPNYVVYKLTHKTPSTLSKRSIEILEKYFEEEIELIVN